VNIVTKFDPPPIPDRQYDWSACVEGSDENDHVGWGSTEEAAIEDLKIELESK
jgi:hypothetical protein